MEKRGIEGKCLKMCPRREVELRERERLLHILETIPKTERSRIPKAWTDRVVKAFSRSAAGRQVNDPENVRPPRILRQTVHYLLCDVFISRRVPFHIVCDFITDRLMAVRQDMVVQDISSAENIAILQPIVRYHAFITYKLSDKALKDFDPTLNNKHLQESLKKLLYCYDDCNQNHLLELQAEFEALYILFNLGNNESLARAISFPRKIRPNVLETAIEISLCFKYNNFIRVCRLIKGLPTILSAIVSLHLPEIRRKAFQTMCSAYNRTIYPTQILKNILLYDSIDVLLSDLEYYGIYQTNQINRESVLFTKISFLGSKGTIKPRHEKFVDEKLLFEDIQNLLLKT